MKNKANGTDNDRMFCWEQVARSNPAFRISRVFAPRRCVDKLLPVYALFSAVQQIRSVIEDEEVARSKLVWWRNECLVNEASKSLHPIIRELTRTGAVNDLRPESIERLLAGAESRLLASAPTDMSALKKACIELQQPQLDLEIEASGMREVIPVLAPGVLARNGLLQLIRESAYGKEQGGFWWIPLNLLAKHAVRREDITADPEALAVSGLMDEVLATGESWGTESMVRSRGGVDEYSRLRHVFAINGVYSRKLHRLQGAAPNRYAGELAKLGPLDLLEAWKSARRGVSSG